MQNWNQWPVPPAVGTISTSVPPPPTGYSATTGTDPMATMQAYMQYYNQPAPAGYTPEQWAAAQQQNWAQWQQWQQQYQQWQAQYGEKYQESMKQYTGQAPPLPITSQPPPPPPKDESKPPLPPTSAATSYGYSTAAPPPPPSTTTAGVKRPGSNLALENAKRAKDEELSVAEKKFDDQFRQWEEKFNQWKQQNANHPDKAQYQQYEAKWTAMREKLVAKREQMRRKREQEMAALKAQESKDMPSGDKIMNILSSTQNQGLINNLLGIGKTLGLTSKQDQTHPTATTSMSNLPPMNIQPPVVAPQIAMTPMMQPDMNQAWTQWSQYNPAMNTNMTAPPMSAPPMSAPYTMSLPMTNAPPPIIPTSQPNFSQPPPSFTQPPPNFSQPPPNFSQPPPPINTSQPPPNLIIPTPQQPPSTTTVLPFTSQPPPHMNNQPLNAGINVNQNNQTPQIVNEQQNQQNQLNQANQNKGKTRIRNRGDDYEQDDDDFDNRRVRPNRSGNFRQNNDDSYNDDYDDDRYNNDDRTDNRGNKENKWQQNEQQALENMPPELRKLMEKRKAAADAFKPSSNFDSSVGVGSLRESFRKVGGFNKFGKNDEFDSERDFEEDDFGNRSSGNFGNRGRNDFVNQGRNEPGNRGNNFGTRGRNDFDDDSPDNFRNRGSDNFRNTGRNDFGNRGPGDFDDGPNNFNNRGRNEFVNRGTRNFDDGLEIFRNRGRNNFEDGPNNFGNSDCNDFDDGPNNFNNRGRNNFGSRGPNDFDDGQNNFNNRGRNDFGNRGGPTDYRNRIPNRGPNDSGNRGPNDFGNRGPNDFGNRGPCDFEDDQSSNFSKKGNQDFDDGPNNFCNRGPNEFGTRGPNEFGNRGPTDFGNRGPTDFGNRGPSNFGNRGPSDFGNRGPSDFGNRPPNDFTDKNNWNKGRAVQNQRKSFSDKPPYVDDELCFAGNRFNQGKNEAEDFDSNKQETMGKTAWEDKLTVDKQNSGNKGSENKPIPGPSGNMLPDMSVPPMFTGPPPPFKPNQFNEAPPPLGQQENLSQSGPPPSSAGSLKPIPSLLSLRIAPPPNLKMAPGQKLFDDKENKEKSDGQEEINSGPFGQKSFDFNKPPPFTQNKPAPFGPGTLDKNFGPSGPNRPPFEKDASPSVDNKFGLPVHSDEIPQDTESNIVPQDSGPVLVPNVNDWLLNEQNKFGPPDGDESSFDKDGPLESETNVGTLGSDQLVHEVLNNDIPAIDENAVGPEQLESYPPVTTANIDFTEDSFDPVDASEKIGDAAVANTENINTEKEATEVGKPLGENASELTNFKKTDVGESVTDNLETKTNVNEDKSRPGFTEQYNDDQFMETEEVTENRDGQQFRPGPMMGSLKNFGPTNNKPGLLGDSFNKPGIFNKASGPFDRSFARSGNQFDKPFSSFDRSSGSFDQSRGPFEKPSGSFDGPRGSFDKPGGSFDGPRGHFDKPGVQFDGSRGPFDKSGGVFDGPRGPFDKPVGTFDKSGPFDGPRNQFDKSGPFDGSGGSFDGPRGSFDKPGGPFDKPGGSFDGPRGLFDKSNGTFEKSSGPYSKPLSGPLDTSSGSLDRTGGFMDRSSGPLDRPSGPLEIPSGSLDRPSGPFDRHSGPFEKPRSLLDGPFDKPSGLLDRPRGLLDTPQEPFDKSSASLVTPGSLNKLPSLFDKSFGPPGSGSFNEASSYGSRHGDSEPEFHIGKQFNYNHGGKPQNQVSEFVRPTKVIDYGHDKSKVQTDAGPACIYDYGHGNLNPVITNVSKDYKDWEENEQNIQEYNEEMVKRSEKMGKLWGSSSPPQLGSMKSLFDIPMKNKDRDERFRDDRSRDRDRDERSRDRDERSRDRDDRLKDDRSRDKDDRLKDDRSRDRDRDRDKMRGRDRDDRYSDRKDRDDRYRDSDRHRSKDRYRNDRDKSRDKDRDDRYKDREDRHKDRDDRHKDRDERHKDRDDRYKDRDDRYKDRDDKYKDKDRTSEKDRDDLRNKLDKSLEQKEESMEVDETNCTADKSKEQEDKASSSKEPEKVDDSLPEVKSTLDGPPKIMELPKTPNLTMVDDLLCPPSRLTRPPKIAIILRGPPGSGKSYVAKLIKDKEVAQGGSAPRMLSIDDYFLVEKDDETGDEKKDGVDEMEYKYEEAMESEYVNHLIKAFKKNVTDGFFNFIILDSVNEKISDYEEMWSFAKTKGFKVYVCEMEMDVQVCLKRNIHNRSEDDINRIIDYFEPTPGHHHKLDVTSLLQDQAIQDVEMEDVQETPKDEDKDKDKDTDKDKDSRSADKDKDTEVKEKEATPANDDSQDSQEDTGPAGVSKWEKMETEDKLDRLDGLKRKSENKPKTMEEFLQVPDYYNLEDNSGKKHVRWADLEERKHQEKMRAVGFVVGQTNWNRMMDPTYGSSALTRTKYI